jgi:fibronectin-binding autotransporter adhesin
MKTSTSPRLNFHLMEKSTLTCSIMLSLLFLLCMNFSSYGASISYTGASGGNWNVASNWSGGVLPTTDDDVTISGKTVNVVSGDNFVAGSVIVQNSGTATVGTLNILSGGTLTISSGTVSSVFLKIYGGVVNNQGTLNVTLKSGSINSAILLSNTAGSTTKMPSTLNNSGTLTVDASTGGATSICVTLGQTDTGVSPTLNTGSGINLIANNVSTAFVFDVSGRDALITGSGIISVGSVGTPLLATFVRVLSSTTSNSLTIDQNVTLNYVGSGYAFMNYTSGSAVCSSTVINKGTINLSGTSNNPIFMTAQGTNASSFTKFDNQGTIHATGAPASSTSGVVTFNSSGNSILLNSGTINFNPTSNGALINTSSATANVSITNSGTMTVGGGTALTNAIVLGDSKTSLTNTGTINIASGLINGLTGTGNALFNNNTIGVLNLTNTIASSILVGNTAFSLINNGGTINTPSTINAVTIRTGTTGATFTSGIFSPGGDATNGKINFTNSLSFNGTINMNVTGVTTAGTDYDQIIGSYPTTDINISGATLALTMSTLTPANGTNITLINYTNTGCTVTGTFGTVTGLASGWSVLYTANAVKLQYDLATDNKSIEVAEKIQTVKAASNAMISNVKGSIQILSLSGQVIKNCIVEVGQVIPITSGAYLVHYKSAVQKVIIY